MSSGPRRGRLGLLVIGIVVVVVGIGAFTGSAAGTASNLTIEPDVVNSSTDVSLGAIASTPGRDLTFAIDADTDGHVRSDEHLGTVTSNGTDGSGIVTVTPGTYVSGEGAFPVYVIEENTSDGTDDTTYPIADPPSFYDANDSLTVDDTAPGIGAFGVTNPAGREVSVSFESDEPVAAITVEVHGPVNTTLTEGDFLRSGTGPYEYNATYFAPADGEYTASLVNAADAAGNDGATGETDAAIAALVRRNAERVFETPAPLYLGEEGLDVSLVTGEGTVTFEGRSGEAAGTIATGRATAVDVTAASGFRPGGYDATGDGDTDFSVAEPTVRAVTVLLGNASSGINASGGYVPPGSTVTVTAAFGFGSADSLEVTVRSEAGVDVTPMLTDDPVIAESGDTVGLDFGETDLEVGRYAVGVESTRLNVTASTTVDIVESDAAVTVDRTEVTRGRPVTVTAFGPPGSMAVIRVARSALGNESTAPTEVFDRTGDVEARVGTGSPYVGAVTTLGRDGIGRVRVRTRPLQTGSADLEFVTGNVGNLTDPAADSARVAVRGRDVSLDAPPAVVVIGEEVTLEGTAPESETVIPYAKVGDEWRPLTVEGTTDVRSDGSFSLAVKSAKVLGHPGAYRIAVAGYVDSSVPTGAVSPTSLREQPVDYQTLKTVDGSLTASLARETIAARDDATVRLTGGYAGPGETIYVYRVGPRGRVHGTAIDAEGSEYEVTLDGFERRGTHRIVVVGPGRDGSFSAGSPAAVAASIPSSSSPEQAIDRLHDRYTGPGVDDRVLTRKLRAAAPMIAVDGVAIRSTETGRSVTVRGSTNLPRGETLSVRILNSNDGTVGYNSTRLDETGVWRLDVALEGGQTPQALRVTDGRVSTVHDVVRTDGSGDAGDPDVAEANRQTPTQTTEWPSDPARRSDQPPTPTPGTHTVAETRSSRGQPGFHWVSSALGIFAVFAWRIGRAVRHR